MKKISKYISLMVAVTFALSGVADCAQWSGLRPTSTQNGGPEREPEIREQRLVPSIAGLLSMWASYGRRDPVRFRVENNIEGAIIAVLRRLERGDKSAAAELTMLLQNMQNYYDLMRIVFSRIYNHGDNANFFEFYNIYITASSSLRERHPEEITPAIIRFLLNVNFLANRGFRSARSSLESLKTHEDSFIQSAAKETLSRVGSPSTYFLFQDATVRLNVLRDLVNHVPRNFAADFLVSALKDGHELSKIYAAWGLGMLRHEDAKDLLISTARETGNPSLVRACALSLATMGISPKENGVKAKPLYDLNDVDEELDFNSFNPLTAQRDSGVTLGDIRREAMNKMALYPYMSAVYLVKVEGEYEKATMRKDMRGVGSERIADKMSFMSITKENFERFYEQGETVAIMFQLSSVHGRAVFDVDENGNWYQLKGVGLVNNARLNDHPLWQAPELTSNTDSGLADVNMTNQKDIIAGPLDVEEAGGDISKLMAMTRFRRMVEPMGSGFREAPRFKPNSDDENVPDWKPTFIPGTHLTYFGKEARRIGELADFDVPNEFRLNWFLSEAGFLDIDELSKQSNGFYKDKLQDYLVWYSRKIGREVAKLINAEKSHYFIGNLHNATLAGKVVDFESIQFHKEVEQEEHIALVRRDIDHAASMLSEIFVILCNQNIVEIVQEYQHEVGMMDFELGMMNEKLKCQFLESLDEHIDKDKKWVVTAVRAGLK
ncbi:HEAT repeat domain-containing protein, partial [Candidatus Omnitrophota bacterium]